MSTIIERKVKKRPIVVHRPKKVVNSQDKSLHRSMLSHSRIATGYKKKIAALLGNNRALAHALEMAHVELTNRDKLTIELQRRLTLQSPKRFKSKIQKVCEHLHVIVALLQDVLDDCEDFTEPNTCSFSSQISNSSRPDIVHARYQNESPRETQHLNNLVNSNAERDTTPLPLSQQPPRLTTAAEMSAILEQSVLLADENLPPILFPEDENQAISNITTRPKSKSRSTSSRPTSRGSKIHTESPQSRKNSSITIANNGKGPDDDNEVAVSPLTNLFNPDQSPKQNSIKENFTKPQINKSICLDDSQKEFQSPKKTSNSENSVKKTVSKKKTKKKILVVKLPCTPKRSLARENMVDTIHTEEQSDSCVSKTSASRRRTFTVNKTKKVDRRTFVLSTDTTKKAVDAVFDESHTERLESIHKVSSPSKQLFTSNDYDKNGNNHNRNVTTKSVKCKKEENNSDKKAKAQNMNTVVIINNSCHSPQEMDSTCHSLIEKSVLQTSTKDNEILTSDFNDPLTNGIKPTSNSYSSPLMYGYDPLEGTSKNRKSSILLKKPKTKSPKSKLTSKIPQIKEKLPKMVSINKPNSNKKSTRVGTSDVKIQCVKADPDIVKKASLQNSSSKCHLSSALKDSTNSPLMNSHQELVDSTEYLPNSTNNEYLENHVHFRNSLFKTSPSHTAINKIHKESVTAARTESSRNQEVSSLDSVQPVVKLNDIWTSVKSPLPINHCDNYVYIPDLLDGSVLKVDTTPKKQMLQLEKETDVQNSNKEEEIKDTPKIVETNSGKICLDDAQDIFNVDGNRKRRGASSYVSYKEPSLNKKLRQGDPFTSDIQNVNNRRKKEKEKSKRKARSCASKKTYFESVSSSSEDSEGC